MKAKILTGKYKDNMVEVIEVTKDPITPIKVMLNDIELRYHSGELQFIKQEEKIHDSI